MDEETFFPYDAIADQAAAAAAAAAWSRCFLIYEMVCGPCFSHMPNCFYWLLLNIEWNYNVIYRTYHNYNYGIEIDRLTYAITAQIFLKFA